MNSLRKRFHDDGYGDKALKDRLQRPPSPEISDHEREAVYSRTSIDAPSALRPNRKSIDLVDAANVARSGRGETRLPVEPSRMESPRHTSTSRTRAGSVPRYAGEPTRVGAAAESTLGQRAPMNATRLPLDAQHIYNSDMTPPSSPSRAFQRKPLSSASPERQANSITYKTRDNSAMNGTNQRTFHGIDEIRPLAPAVPPKDAPVVPPKSNRRSIDGAVIGGLSRIPSPAPVTKMDIFKKDGTLHERYTTNTEEVHRLGEQFARAVIHEKIIASVHNVITTAISRDIHTHEVRQHILPIMDKRFLPERHWIQTADGRFVEVNANEVEAAKERYTYATRVEESVSAVKIEGQPFEQTDDFPDHYFKTG